MQVAGLQPLPILVRYQDVRYRGPDGAVLDDFFDGLAVAYVAGPRYGQRPLSWADLDRLRWSRPALRQAALDTLDRRLGAMQVYGQPPALMLSFEGLESSLLLADAVWDELARIVPGDVVVGVPARDVVIVTGTRSPPGLERVRRAVDRMFCARQRYPLSPHLLVRRGRGWEPLTARWGARRAS